MDHRNIAAVALVLVAFTTLAGAKDVAVIANKSNAAQEISTAALSQICKGQLDHWPDGKPVTLVIREPGSPEMNIVLTKIYEMPIDEVKAVIANANHGRADHPAIMVVASDDAAVKKVESTPGALGLVDVYSITGKVTVLKLGGKLPLEPGYLLHGN